MNAGFASNSHYVIARSVFCDEAISKRVGEIASPREKRPGLAMTPQIENCWALLADLQDKSALICAQKKRAKTSHLVRGVFSRVTRRIRPFDEPSW